MADYKIISCHVLWRELCYYASLSNNVFDFTFLEQGLHDTPDQLREEVQKAVDTTENKYDAILLGYGLCSNGIADVIARDIPLILMRGHDCITFLLGSRERYAEYFEQNPGTYWYTPGWIDTSLQPGKERYERTYQKYVEEYGEDNAAYLMEMEQAWFQRYTNAAYVDLNFVDNESYKQYTRECAEYLNWNYDELTGDPGLIKRFLEGDWKSEDFIICQPGQKFAPSHDEKVLNVVQASDEV